MKVLDQEKNEQLMRLINAALSLCDQFPGSRLSIKEYRGQSKILSAQIQKNGNIVFSTTDYLFRCGDKFLNISYDIHSGLSWAYSENQKMLNAIGACIHEIISRIVEKNDTVKYEIKTGIAF